MVFGELWLSGCLQSVFRVEMLNPQQLLKISGAWGINCDATGLTVGNCSWFAHMLWVSFNGIKHLLPPQNALFCNKFSPS